MQFDNKVAVVIGADQGIGEGHAVAPHAPAGGVIVNQSSTSAWMNTDYYSFTKLAINGITCVLTREPGPRGIRVNTIAPGPTNTQALRDKGRRIAAGAPWRIR